MPLDVVALRLGEAHAAADDLRAGVQGVPTAGGRGVPAGWLVVSGRALTRPSRATRATTARLCGRSQRRAAA